MQETLLAKTSTYFNNFTGQHRLCFSGLKLYCSLPQHVAVMLIIQKEF